MFSRIKSATLQGIDALIVNVEVDMSMGLPGWQIVGLPETMIRESKERVTSAIRNSGLEIASKKITINLAPAGIKKHGTLFDLPIAAGLLASSGLYPANATHGWMVLGELSLAGGLNPVQGVISIVMAARRAGFKGVILPFHNTSEARLVRDIDIIGVKDLTEVVGFLKDGVIPSHPPAIRPKNTTDPFPKDFSEIKGQNIAKRAMEIAAAGRHHILMYGPPGTGKTMLAERITTILPRLGYEEALQVTRIYSLFGILDQEAPLIETRPFRAPHHSASYAGLVGGGQGSPRPGEISLAHNGILFMDELPEFRKDVLESLRQPLECGRVTITRSKQSLTYPANFMLVAAMNPCSCGYFGHPLRPCICTISQLQNYRRRISGPLLDRLDLHVNVPPLSLDKFHADGSSSECSASVRRRVMDAVALQTKRYKGTRIGYNSELNVRALREFCPLSAEAKSFIIKMAEKMSLSVRAHDRILRVARTIADLNAEEPVSIAHLSEAAQFRALDRDIR